MEVKEKEKERKKKKKRFAARIHAPIPLGQISATRIHAAIPLGRGVGCPQPHLLGAHPVGHEQGSHLGNSSPVATQLHCRTWQSQ